MKKRLIILIIAIFLYALLSIPQFVYIGQVKEDMTQQFYALQSKLQALESSKQAMQSEERFDNTTERAVEKLTIFNETLYSGVSPSVAFVFEYPSSWYITEHRQPLSAHYFDDNVNRYKDAIRSAGLLRGVTLTNPETGANINVGIESPLEWHSKEETITTASWDKDNRYALLTVASKDGETILIDLHSKRNQGNYYNGYISIKKNISVPEFLSESDIAVFEGIIESMNIYDLVHSDWESWTNNANDFVVKIPRDWKIQQSDAGGASLVQILAPNAGQDKVRISLPQLEFTYDLKDSEIATIKAIEETFVKNPNLTQIQNSKIIP